MTAFRTLRTVLAAHVQGDDDGFAGALREADAPALCAQATRHKCAAVLFEAAVARRGRSSEARTVIQLLKTQMATFALDARSTREQLHGIIRALDGAGVPFALLKSAGRLYAGDTLAERTQTFDIDVLIPPDAIAACTGALFAAGYKYENDAHVAGYLKYHHHLAPLVHPAYRKALEVHVALAPAEMYSLPCDWASVAGEMESIDGAAGRVLRLNAPGRAWHMALHGAMLYRLGDAVQIAMETLRHDREIPRHLLSRSTGERILRIPLQAVLHVAASLAGVALCVAPQAQHYAAWASRREDLPPALRTRAQFADAWYANGGTLSGPATRLAFPRAFGQNGVPVPLRSRARALAGSTLAAAAMAFHAPLQAHRS